MSMESAICPSERRINGPTLISHDLRVFQSSRTHGLAVIAQDLNPPTEGGSKEYIADDSEGE